jgi:uncharacterized protein YaiL (DUF2058 family)
MTSYSKTMKICRKTKIYVSDMKGMMDENDLWDEKTKCQVNTVRQSRKRRRLRRKGVIEEKGFNFLWKLEAERAKGDELEIERVVKNCQKEYADQQVEYSTELEPDDKKDLLLSFRR